MLTNWNGYQFEKSEVCWKMAMKVHICSFFISEVLELLWEMLMWSLQNKTFNLCLLKNATLIKLNKLNKLLQMEILFLKNYSQL